MPEENELPRDDEESVRHAQWVREHPQMDESGFPEYPDELSRRGSSRGAVPNGNPWRPVDPEEKPGRPDWDADTEPAALRTQDERATADGTSSAEPTERVATPPAHGEPVHQPAIVVAGNEADERIGNDIGDVLAASKALEGKHLLVEIVDGEVFLHGTVADQAVRSEVEQLTSSVRGVGRIHNELDVRS